MPGAAYVTFVGTPLSGVAPLSVAFTDTSSPTPSVWLWNFGDGGTSAVQNPTHVYGSAGSYTVSLTGTQSGTDRNETKAAYVVVTAAPNGAAPNGLPELTMPAGLPHYRWSGHSATPRSVYATVGMRTGHARKRRVATSAPRIVNVELFLSASQMVTFDAWFENGLLAGQRAFSARVANQGTGLLWWHAEWVDTPKLTPTYGGHWAVAGSLLLTGDGSVAGPVSTSAAMELIGGLVGSVTGAAPDGQAAMEITVALALASPVSMEINVALTATATGAAKVHELREDGSFELREDSSFELRE